MLRRAVRVFDERSAQVHVFTFKDGLLSAVAHDLKLRFEQFRIEIEDDGSAVRATFDTSSLVVVCARKDGVDAPNAMPRAFHGEIEDNIAKHVLEPRKFRDATFTSSRVTEHEIVGALTLHGVTREVRITREGTAGTHGRVRIDQRDFGIKPFTAMMGTLKIKPHVDIELTVDLIGST